MGERKGAHGAEAMAGDEGLEAGVPVLAVQGVGLDEVGLGGREGRDLYTYTARETDRIRNRDGGRMRGS